MPSLRPPRPIAIQRPLPRADRIPKTTPAHPDPTATFHACNSPLMPCPEPSHEPFEHHREQVGRDGITRSRQPPYLAANLSLLHEIQLNSKRSRFELSPLHVIDSRDSRPFQYFNPTSRDTTHSTPLHHRPNTRTLSPTNPNICVALPGTPERTGRRTPRPNPHSPPSGRTAPTQVSSPANLAIHRRP